MIKTDFKEFLENKFDINLNLNQISIDGNLNSFGLFILDIKRLFDESTGNTADVTVEIEVCDRNR